MWLRHNGFYTFYTVAPYILGFSMGFSVLKVLARWPYVGPMLGLSQVRVEGVSAPGVGVARVYHQSDRMYFWNLN